MYVFVYRPCSEFRIHGKGLFLKDAEKAGRAIVTTQRFATSLRDPIPASFR